MSEKPSSKHETRSAKTRESFILAAQKLYSQRSIDAVSLNEITTAAGQKNRNALQYHFGSKDGLLQAIIDAHAKPVQELRSHYIEQASICDWSAAEAAARVLVMPLADYIQRNADGIHYVKILSQLAAINSDIINPTNPSKISFVNVPKLNALLTEAVSHLPKVEAQRRVFFVVSITFHSIADIFRAAQTGTEESIFHDPEAMFEQVVSAIEALISAPARE
ncbi:MAG: AcrR family transcriptional regulator [Cryomorphaceae bacterium]|jgi:AcrR family transcriptional regulator